VLDLKLIRDNPDAFDAACKARGLPPLAETILSLDAERKSAVSACQEAQTRRNQLSKEIGKAKGAKNEVEAERLMAEVAKLKDVIRDGEAAEKEATARLEQILVSTPNTPAEDVPVGKDEADNVELRKWGTPPKFDFAPKQHFELGETLGLMDFETAAKISGARFVVLKGALARLERALAAFMLDLHTGEYGYTEINPPLMVRDDAAFGTAQLPKFRDDLFSTKNEERIGEDEFDITDVNKGKVTIAFCGKRAEELRTAYFGKEFQKFDFIGGEIPKNSDVLTALKGMMRPIVESTRWLIPTAEVPLTNLAREQIHDETTLPYRFTAHTPCFRSEAGSAGKDTRGMIRLHQFSKVEMVSVTTPEQSAEEHERMTACAEEVLKRLALPYRVIVLCTGDMGFAARKTYDLEVWLPGQDTYREISSCSNCGDFQARRMNARCRKQGAKDIRFCHTLNGSGLAVGRTLVAVMENYQQADGSIRVPDVLVPYMSGMTVISA
jgi:seryl-tRNA synthetase